MTLNVDKLASFLLKASSQPLNGRRLSKSNSTAFEHPTIQKQLQQWPAGSSSADAFLWRRNSNEFPFAHEELDAWSSAPPPLEVFGGIEPLPDPNASEETAAKDTHTTNKTNTFGLDTNGTPYVVGKRQAELLDVDVDHNDTLHMEKKKRTDEHSGFFSNPIKEFLTVSPTAMMSNTKPPTLAIDTSAATATIKPALISPSRKTSARSSRKSKPVGNEKTFERPLDFAHLPAPTSKQHVEPEPSATLSPAEEYAMRLAVCILDLSAASSSTVTSAAAAAAVQMAEETGTKAAQNVPYMSPSVHPPAAIASLTSRILAPQPHVGGPIPPASPVVPIQPKKDELDKHQAMTTTTVLPTPISPQRLTIQTVPKLSHWVSTNLIQQQTRSAGVPTNAIPEDEDVSKLDKAQLKRMRNRISASRCRLKRKMWTESMQRTNTHLTKLIAEVEGYIKRLEEERDNILKMAMFTPML